MSTTSQRFGQRVARALGAGPGRTTLAAQRARIAALSDGYVPPHRGRAWALSGAALAPVAALILFVAWPREFSADFAGQRVAEAELIEPKASSEPLRFSDGSSIVLAPKTRLKVERLSNTEVTLTLARGRVSAAIEKGRRWAISAGPYTVRVVGTRFSVDYEGGDGKVAVRVEEGQVAVKHERGEEVLLGPGMNFERGARVASHAPETRLDARTPTSALASTPPSSVSSSAAAPNRSETSWSALAGRGKYKDALALAEKQGFFALLQSENESDLLLLANTARYAGDRPKAQRAFLSIRQRFPGRPGSALSAFYLARLAEDKDQNLDEAARWLRTFLRESPSGDLAASARASLLGLLIRKGDHAGARIAAADYLEHHPSGPHAAEARAVLEQRSSR